MNRPMVTDAHVHIGSFASYADLGDKIRTTEDVAGFRTRDPALYQARLSEAPVDNTDQLIADMDAHGVARAVVQASPGYITNAQVAEASARYPDRLVPLLRIGHDQEAAGYLEDPSEVRSRAGDEVAHCVESLHMKGVGETFVRALTCEMHPEKI
ncbi:MAG: hypothetical protein ACYDAG_19215, partial [Chloroflexota bacterium]